MDGQLAGTISGTVSNGTTGTPAANAAVSLIALKGDMQPIGNATTDAEGRFQFSQPPPANAPLLVEVNYKGVPYFQPLPPGQSSARVEVFEPSTDESKVHVNDEIVIVQPIQNELAVGDEFVVSNNLQPKRTLYRQGGIFRFRLPPGIKPDGARVVGPSGMPINRDVVPTAAAGIYTIDYPLKPGETRLQTSFRVSYGSQRATLSLLPLYHADHVRIYVPMSMAFASSEFTQIGEQDNYRVYEAQPGVTRARYTVSGTAAMPSEAQAGNSAAQGQAGGAENAQQGTAANESPNVSQSPPPKSFLENGSNLWVLLSLLVIGAAAGFGYLMSRGEDAQQAEPAKTRPAVRMGHEVKPAPKPQMPRAHVADSDGLPSELAKLKDDLFLLEVRRSTGNVSDEEYANLRAALDARMQQLARR